MNNLQMDMMKAPQYLGVSDLQEMFGVDRSKTRLMMDALPSIRVGTKTISPQLH